MPRTQVEKEARQTHIVALAGGLNTQTSALLLGAQQMNGLAISLVNMEPGKGYTRLKGFSDFEDLKGLEGSTRVVGIEVHNNQVFVSKLAQNNLLIRVEEFDNSAWTKASVSTTANITMSPFSTAVADKLYENTSTAEHYMFQSTTKSGSALPYTFSMFVKPAGRSQVKITLDDGAGNGTAVIYDVSAGSTVLTATDFGTGFTAAAGSITDFDYGWYRIKVSTTTNTATTLRAVLALYNGGTSYAGDGSSGVFVFGAKLEQSSTLGFYTKTEGTILSGTRYDIFKRSVGDNHWVPITGPSLAIATDGRVRSAEHNFSGTEKITFVDGTNDARVWDGTTLTAVTAGSNTGPKYATIYRNRLVLSGFSNNTNIVALSVPNDDDSFSAVFGAVEVNFGAKVNAVRGFRKNMFMFGDTRIKVLTGATLTDFLVDDVTTEMGCVAPDSLVEVGGDLYYWSTDGIRPIGASDTYGDVNLGTISIPIRPTIVNALRTDSYDTRELKSVLVRDKSQARYFFSKSDANNDDDVPGLLFCLMTDGTAANNQGGPHWEFSELIGINPSCCASGYIDGKEYVMHGGFDGGVYRQESGATFDGRNILTIYQSPHMDLGDPEIRKTLHRIRAFLDLRSDVSIDMSVIYDYGDDTVTQPNNYHLDLDYAASIYNSDSTIYNNADTLYSENITPVQVSSIEGSGKTVSIRLVCVDATSQYNINGIVLDFSPEGRE